MAGMSDDPIQALVNKLDAIECAIENLAVEIHAVPIATAGKKPDAVEKAAERGALKVAVQIAHDVSALRDAAHGLQQALVPAQKAAWALEKFSKWRISVIALAALLGASMAFIGGVYTTRSGLALTTEIGCTYLGGKWSPDPGTNTHFCWRR